MRLQAGGDDAHVAAQAGTVYGRGLGLYGKRGFRIVAPVNHAHVPGTGQLAANPLMDRFDVDITRVIESGDQVTVDPAGGLVVVRR